MRFISAVTVLLTLTFAVWAGAEVELSQVTAGEENGHFTATLQFNTPVAVEDLKVDLLKDSLDITIPNGRLPTEKNFVEVGKEPVKSVSSVTSGSDVLTKIIFSKGFKADKESYRLVSNGDQVKVLFRKPGQEWSLAALGIDGIIPVSLEEAPVVAVTAAKTVQAAAVDETKIELDTKKPENEIPVLIGKNKKDAAERSPFFRLIISLGVIATLAIGLVQFSKWWQKRHGKTGDTNRIRMLTQHHLGPKKSLAIIRVAGETILIGVTDHNISMIKTLALLEDEDVPELVPQSFAGEMEKNGVKAEDNENDSAFAQVRDRISTRIKEMRPL